MMSDILSIKLESEDGNHLRMLRLQYQRLLMYRRFALSDLHGSPYCKEELILLDVAELLKNYPNL
jgi:hypothetical protein